MIKIGTEWWKCESSATLVIFHRGLFEGNCRFSELLCWMWGAEDRSHGLFNEAWKAPTRCVWKLSASPHFSIFLLITDPFYCETYLETIQAGYRCAQAPVLDWSHVSSGGSGSGREKLHNAPIHLGRLVAPTSRCFSSGRNIRGCLEGTENPFRKCLQSKIWFEILNTW